MKTKLKALAKATLPVVAGALTFAATPAVEATLLISESFSAADLPTDWTAGPGGTGVYPAIKEHNGQNMLWMNRPAASAPGAGTSTRNVFYYNGTGIDNSVPDGKLSNFQSSVIINTGNMVSGAKTTSSVGMVVKSPNTGYAVNTGGYYIGFLPASTSTDGQWQRGFGIWNNVSNHTTNSTTALDFATFDIFTSDIDVLLQITSFENDLSASIWTVDANGNALAEIASVSIDNASTAAGYLGLRTGFSNSDVSAYFRDFQVHSIPEPATALLLLPAAAFLIYRKQRVASRH